MKEHMTEDEALAWLGSQGVKVLDGRIPAGSYSLKTWKAIDCLRNHCKGYVLVN